MFGYDNVKTVTICIADPTKDNTYKVMRVPSRNTKAEILAAWAEIDTTVTQGAGTGVALVLSDYGAAGTAEAGTVASTLGGTAVTWTANVPKTFTISEGTMDGGDWLVLKYDEEGTIAPLNITVGVEWVNGVGA